jgi:glycosyltransferase involved in cell wall biosynthesis
MTSIVIAAHDEAAVVGRTLDALLAEAAPGEFDVTVVANGCTDDTAAVAAARSGVRVLDRREPGKVGALNAGDAVAVGFPRLYLDADIPLRAADVRALAAAVHPAGAALAAAPRRELVAAGRPLVVRGYTAVHSRLPGLRGALVGRGAVMLSEAARSRFGEFPDVVADDLFLDSIVGPDERVEVAGVVSRVATPYTTRDLLRRLERVRRGNAALRAAGSAGALATDAGAWSGAGGSGPADHAAGPGRVRAADRWSWLRDVVLPRPWLLPAGAVYATVTLVAARRARRPATGPGAWGRDASTRTVTTST